MGYQRILVPTDGSDAAANAAAHAIDLAGLAEAELHVLHVVDTGALASTVDAEMLYGALEEAGRTAIEDLRERARAAGIEPVVGSLARGAPHRAILDYVDEHDVDLLVMGTHGRTGLDRYLLGSVTEKVVRLSPVPVLTVSQRSKDGS